MTISLQTLRRLIAGLLALLALLMTVHGMTFLTVWNNNQNAAANLLMAGMFIFALALSVLPPPSGPIPDSPVPDRPVNKPVAALGIICMIMLSLMNGNLIDLDNAFYEVPLVPYWIQFLLLVVGI